MTKYEICKELGLNDNQARDVAKRQKLARLQEILDFYKNENKTNLPKSFFANIALNH